MRTIEAHLTQYAAYHRDKRNIASHFIGVPLIVFAVILAAAQINVVSIHAGWIVVGVASAYYLLLDKTLGLAMLAALVALTLAASLFAMVASTSFALLLALMTFVLGWIVQFIGHKFEGVKPAFVDDITSLAIGPLFVMAEVFFLLGAKANLRRYIEVRVGPTMARRDGKAITLEAVSAMMPEI